MSEKKENPKDQTASDSPAEDHDVQDAPTDGKETPEDIQPTVQQERDDLLGRLQRLSADYLNYQKRAQRDIDQAREFANEQIIKDLLAVMDDMERALDAARANHADDDPLLVGMQLVHDKFFETLTRYGLTVIEAKDKPFDPELHQAIMRQPTDEQEPQTVLAEAVKGYQLRGRTIRPASVVVAVAPEE